MKSKTFRIPSVGKCLVLLFLVLVSFLVAYRYALPAIHRHFAFCPLALSRFDAAKATPIVYGLPTPHGLEEAKQGHILLGGCMLGSTVAVCPHCGVGVKFRDWAAEYKALHRPTP